MYTSRLGNMGAMLSPSANPLITQQEWRSLNSHDGARRDILSPR
jgi:hypothetical protein